MSTDNFQKAYSSLNQFQKKAVDTIDGPVMVMAGPGTGKTQVLTVRIANILTKTDIDPSSVLALTFTDAATREMRARLIALIGKAGYDVRVTTFHSFCSDIIAENPERFSSTCRQVGGQAGSQNITDLEKIEIVTKILGNNSFLLLKPINSPDLYLRDIISAISDLKREGVSVKKFAQLIHSFSEEFDLEKDGLGKTALAEKEKLVSKNLDLLTIYQEYQKELLIRGLFDYEDMINWVVEAFESDEDFLLSYQEKFQYILVDEYQDTNSAQNHLIFALAKFWGENANVFVVGDPDQSIYRFQGASQENTHQFEKLFPKATRITLDQNYRSTSIILSAASAVISNPPLQHNVSHEPKQISVARFDSSIFEDEFLIRSIKEKLKSGISPSDIAVIAKENKDINHLANLFKQNEIPHRLEGGLDILTTPLISQFLKTIHIVANLHESINDLDLFIVLNYPFFNLDPLAILKLSRTAHANKQSLLDTISSCHSERSRGIYNLFVSWNHKATFHTLTQMFQMVLNESGLMDLILKSPRPIIELNRFNTLYEDIKTQLNRNPSLNLFDYAKNLDLMSQHSVKLPEKTLISNGQAVTLTTAHKAKGLEWLIVYIYRFADAHWGNKTNRQMIKLPPGMLSTDISKEDKNGDERRLFYVALTRAKQELYLSGATIYSHSAKMVFPSQFLSELPEEHLQQLDPQQYQKNLPEILVNLLAPAVPTIHAGEEEYLKEIISTFKLSPTALNTYLQCHYKFKLDNLYKIPKAKAPPMCFGTAVHFALENLYRHLNKTGKVLSKKIFLFHFETALKREILSKNEFQERLTHGKEILSAYYDHYHDEFRPALFTEKNSGYITPILLDDIPLSGKIDRIDKLTGTGQVRLIDYKTGAPKPRDDNYKRQLVFYNLLFQLDPSFKYSVADTELEFIEAEKDNKFRRERFAISSQEIEDLKQVIRQSIKEIRALNFSRTTDISICSRCEFKNHCYPSGLPTLVDDKVQNP